MPNQLQINFDRKNSFRDHLRDGQFTVLVEFPCPKEDEPFKLAMKESMDLAAAVNKDPRVHAIAITHNYLAENCHSLLKVLQGLQSACTKEICAFLSGRGEGEKNCRSIIASLVSNGVMTICPVTGVAGGQHPRDKQGRAVYDAEGYLDSCRQLTILRKEYPEVYAGSTVNPFKYNISDTYLQYSKMIRKLNSGASFLVAQAGWDMRKFQEMQWYLQSREIDEPMVARLLLLRPQDISPILENKRGGLVISREFGALLQRESQLSDVQAMTAQIRRVALQAAGCRFLGFSGIQLAGLRDAQTAAAVLDKVAEALEEFSSYNDWLAAWSDFHDRIEMAPYPHRYFAFKNLLEKDLPRYDKEDCPHTTFTLPEPASFDRFRFQLSRSLNLSREDGMIKDLIKRAVCQSNGQNEDDVSRTFGISSCNCPKGLEEGACGGTQPDGTCEFGDRLCYFHRVLALADWAKDLEALERVERS